MRIVIDMNLSPEWVKSFHEAGFEAVHWSEVGNPKAKDTDIVEWAIKNNAIVFTNDLDFGIILAITKARQPSVIQARTHDLLPDALSYKVISLLNLYAEQLEKGALITIDEMKNRIRILPI